MPKFTDEQVAEDKELQKSALLWLETYEGEFYFLKKMKWRLEVGRPFSIAQLRGILNAMDYAEEVEAEKEFKRHLDAHKEFVEEHIPHYTEATFHASYVNAKQSFVFHKIESGYYLWLATGPQLVVVPQCSTKPLRNAILLRSSDIIEYEYKVVNGIKEELRMCKICAKLET